MTEKYRVFTDATADLSPFLCAGLPPIEIIPMQVEISGKEYTYGTLDGITAQEFYHLQRKGGFATTSQINPTVYFRFFEAWLQKGIDILSMLFGQERKLFGLRSCPFLLFWCVRLMLENFAVSII